MRVLDGAIVVLDAVKGVEAQTITVWRSADRYCKYSEYRLLPRVPDPLRLLVSHVKHGYSSQIEYP
jgi:hypothetical protein